MLTYVNMIGVLLASRMAFDAYGKTDLPAIGIFAAGVALAYALAGFSNFFLRRPFVSDAVLAHGGPDDARGVRDFSVHDATWKAWAPWRMWTGGWCRRGF